MIITYKLLSILGDSIYAKECNRFIDENCHNKIRCTAYLTLCSDTRLMNRIAILTPKPENIKHTPSFWFENNPMKKYL
jgi:hypothetical protein